MQHDQHRSRGGPESGEEAAIPTISLDYTFMGNEDTKASDNPILVAFDGRTKSIGAWQVYKKGAIEWVGREVAKWIKALGY